MTRRAPWPTSPNIIPNITTYAIPASREGSTSAYGTVP